MDPGETTPTDAATGTDLGSLHAYERGWTELVRAIRSGEPWSGDERNAAFVHGRLNDRLVMLDAAPLLGTDDPGDGRSAALIDLDFDGDDDLVLTSRTEPRVRLLRNDLADGAEIVSVRLEGTRSNRDAIGAVLFVETNEPGARNIRRSRSLGGGYLAQSSAWLRVGLGEPADGARRSTRVQLKVRWPAGRGKKASVEDFGEVRAGASYILTQGAGRARQARVDAPVQLSAKSLLDGRAPSQFDDDADYRAVLPTPTSIPSLVVATPAGPNATFFGVTPTGPRGAGKPVLVAGIYASDPGAIAAMGDLAGVAADLATAGIGALAIDLSAVAPDESEAALVSFVQRLRAAGWRHEVVQSSGETNIILEALVRWRFMRDDLPSGAFWYLIDSDGRLSAVRVGPLAQGDILEDLAALVVDEKDRRSRLAALGEGRWFVPPGDVDLARLRALLDQSGAPEAAREMGLARIEVKEPDSYDVSLRFGESHLSQVPPAIDKALLAFERAIEIDPANPLAWRGKAYALQAGGRQAASLDAWSTALKLDETHAATRARRAVVALATGDEALARKDLVILVEAGPSARESASVVRRALDAFEAAGRAGSGSGSGAKPGGGKR